MKLDISKFRRIRGNVLEHPSGHQIILSKDKLSKDHLKQLEAIPMADGGDPEEELLNSAASDDVASREATDEEIAAQKLKNSYNEFGVVSPERQVLMRNSNDPTVLESQAKILGKAKDDEEAPEKYAADKADSDYQDQVRAIQAYNAQAQRAGLPLKDLPAPAQMPDVPSTNIDQKSPTQVTARNPVLGAPSGGGLDMQMRGVRDEAAAQGALGRQQSQIIGNAMAQQQKDAENYQSITQKMNSEYDAFKHDLQNKHIDPNQYWNKMGVGQKVGTAIGILLGGLNPSGTNQVLKMIDQDIDRDISAQKDNLNKSDSLFRANMQQYQNQFQAAAMTKAMHLEMFNSQLQQAAANSQDPLAQARAKQIGGQIQQQKDVLLNQAAAQKLIYDKMNGPAGGGGDPMGPALDGLRRTNPELAKSYEARYVPGVGIGSIPVPDKDRGELVMRKNLQDALFDLQKFAVKNGGSVNPSTMAEGKAKAGLVQDLYRRANGQGVFREAEKEFVGSIIGEDPTKFFKNFRTIPRYKAAISDNLNQLNSLKESYGLPFQPTVEIKEGAPKL